MKAGLRLMGGLLSDKATHGGHKADTSETDKDTATFINQTYVHRL